MQTTEKVKELLIENENNKFSCKFFCQITLAPPADGFVPDLVGKVFFINDNGKEFFVRLKHFTVEPFSMVFSAYTLPCCGLDEWEWKEKFKAKYPNTTNETKIGIYCYERITD